MKLFESGIIPEHWKGKVINLNDAPPREVIGFLDIEASNLSATFGYVFSYCIKRLDGDIIERVLSPDEIKNGQFDKPL